MSLKIAVRKLFSTFSPHFDKHVMNVTFVSGKAIGLGGISGGLILIHSGLHTAGSISVVCGILLFLTLMLVTRVRELSSKAQEIKNTNPHDFRND